MEPATHPRDELEAFSRATMSLSVMSGAVAALALVAQVTAFGKAFLTFALLILPVVLFVGVTTFVRLVQKAGIGLAIAVAMATVALLALHQ